MSTTLLVWLIVLCGAGTFLIRFVPMQWRDKCSEPLWMRGSWRNALDFIGPAAIVALLVVSFWSMVDSHSLLRDALPIAIGLVGVTAGKKYLGSIAWSTLTGVLAYGLTLYGLSLLP